ncbi:hypothetical protein BWR19_01660 [Halomonas sp. 1513]|nr:hypothetical protein [Halomonas sp. 1513]APX91754.1 hypothetical protein BWR19_01660 [Halomonas sp. 1513]
MTTTHSNPSRGHENASVGSPHGHLKRRLQQRLALFGFEDFVALGYYHAFFDKVANAINCR